MTPEERELVRDLFDRLAELEREGRDPDAERLIREGLTRAPNAVYALVQTVLLQDEGLRAADQRIQELEDELARAQPPAPPSRDDSFLGARRGGGKWNTGEVIRGSVPPVGGGDRPMGAPPGFGGERDYPGGPYRDEPPQGGPAGGPWAGPAAGPSRGGSFLGTAAAVAAGALGSSVLMEGIKSALGGQADKKSPFSGALEQLTGSKPGGSPGERSGGGELSRDAGVDDIGGRRTGALQDPKAEQAQAASAHSDDDNFDHDDMHDAYDDEDGFGDDAGDDIDI